MSVGGKQVGCVDVKMCHLRLIAKRAHVEDHPIVWCDPAQLRALSCVSYEARHGQPKCLAREDVFALGMVLLNIAIDHPLPTGITHVIGLDSCVFGYLVFGIVEIVSVIR